MRLSTAAVILLAAGCSAPAEPLAHLYRLQGSWIGTQRTLGGAAVAASYEIRREGENLVWEFHSEFGGGFSGRGVQRWDAGAAEIVETWTDSSAPGQEQTLRGAFDAGAATLVMRGAGPDPEDGATIPYVHTTRILAPDAWSYVMRIEPPGREAQDVMWIEMRRK